MIQRADTGAPAAPRSRIPQQELALVTPTRSPRREVQVGIFVLAGVLAVLVALFVLTDPGLFRGRYYGTTQVTDAGGIRKRDPVQLNGDNIGRVDDLRLVPGGVQLRLELQGEYPVPADSRVRLAVKPEPRSGSAAAAGRRSQQGVAAVRMSLARQQKAESHSWQRVLRP
jgi:hypothetical protein